jgi:hypothetical protein
MEKTHLRVNTWKGKIKIFAFTTVLFAFITRTLYLTQHQKLHSVLQGNVQRFVQSFLFHRRTEHCSFIA